MNVCHISRVVAAVVAVVAVVTVVVMVVMVVKGELDWSKSALSRGTHKALICGHCLSTSFQNARRHFREYCTGADSAITRTAIKKKPFMCKICCSVFKDDEACTGHVIWSHSFNHTL